jgi:hypothetical protein
MKSSTRPRIKFQRGVQRKRLLRNIHRKTQERHRRHLRMQYMLEQDTPEPMD